LRFGRRAILKAVNKRTLALALTFGVMAGAIGAGFGIVAASDSDLAGIVVAAVLIFGGMLVVSRRVTAEFAPAGHAERAPYSIGGVTLMLASGVAAITGTIAPLARLPLLLVGFGVFLLGRRLHPD
jgi:hypothetical protein